MSMSMYIYIYKYVYVYVYIHLYYTWVYYPSGHTQHTHADVTTGVGPRVPANFSERVT